jgi:hypothetical protein
VCSGANHKSKQAWHTNKDSTNSLHDHTTAGLAVHQLKDTVSKHHRDEDSKEATINMLRTMVTDMEVMTITDMVRNMTKDTGNKVEVEVGSRLAAEDNILSMVRDILLSNKNITRTVVGEEEIRGDVGAAEPGMLQDLRQARDREVMTTEEVGKEVIQMVVGGHHHHKVEVDDLRL